MNSGGERTAGGLRGGKARELARDLRLPLRLDFLISPAFVAGVFIAAGALYALFLFPWYDMNTHTLSQLEAARHMDRAYLPFDSGGYLDASNRPLGSILHDAVHVSGLHFGLFSNVTLELIGYAALSIAPWYPYFVISALNAVLFGWAVLHCRAVADRYGADFRWFLPLLLINPLVLFSLFTLNKEALGLFLITGMVRYSLERKWVFFAALLLLSLFTRNIFFFFGLILLLRPFLYEVRIRARRYRVRAGALLVAISLIVPVGLLATHNKPFGSQFGSLDLVARYFGQQTQRILSFCLHIERFPFGYLIAYPIVTAINIASPAFNYRYYADYGGGVNLAQLTLQASSALFVILLFLAYRARPGFALFAIEPLRLFFALTLIASVYPISQHRYLLPFYPLVILTYLVAARKGVGVTERAREPSRRRRPRRLPAPARAEA